MTGVIHSPLMRLYFFVVNSGGSLRSPPANLKRCFAAKEAKRLFLSALIQVLHAFIIVVDQLINTVIDKDRRLVEKRRI